MENKKELDLTEAQTMLEELREVHPELLEALFYLEDLKLFNPEDTFFVKEMQLKRYQTTRYLLDSSYYKSVSRMLPKEAFEQLKMGDDEVR